MLRSQKIAVTTVGTAGSASGDGYGAQPINGIVRALRVDWHANAPAGTSDITITIEADDDHPAITLYAKTNAVTDLWVYPHAQATDTAGAAITGWYLPLVGSGRIKVSVAQCDALTNAVVVTAYVEE